MTSPTAGPMPVLSRHLLLWGAVAAQGVRRDLQFRSQAWTNLLTSVAELALGLVPVLILTTSSAIDDPTAVAGGLVLVGFFGLTTGVMDCLVTPNLRGFDMAVRRGDLDLVLLRPVNAPAYCLLRRVEPAEAGRAVAGLGMIAVGLAAIAEGLTPGRLATAGLLAALGVVAFSLCWTNIVMLAFWVDSAEPINDVAAQVRTAGQYPLAYFPSWARVALLTIAPAGLLSSHPVGVLEGADSLLLPVLLVVMASVAATALHWRAAIKQYSSAS